MIGPTDAAGNDLAMASAAVMAGVTLLAAGAMWTGRRLSRPEGLLLVVAYAVLIVLLTT